MVGLRGPPGVCACLMIEGQIVPLVVSLVFAVVLLGGTALLFKSRNR